MQFGSRAVAKMHKALGSVPSTAKTIKSGVQCLSGHSERSQGCRCGTAGERLAARA